jgi:hypothetical protein
LTDNSGWQRQPAGCVRSKWLSLRAIRDRMAAEGVQLSQVAVGNALKARRLA